VDPADEEARQWLHAIYRAHVGYVWNSLRRLGVADADRDDLAHEVFVIVFRRRADFDPARPIKPWLFGITFRVAAGHRRLLRNTLEHGGDVEQIADDHGTEQQVLAGERRRLVLRALSTIELDQRAVFILHEIDGCSVPEIAASLDVKLNTVYSRLRLAREKFAAAVRRFAEAA
jgi:RNA polymerase sigma-70 factor, ECF subfamily